MQTKSAMITICGRPNVGKSTLINRIVGEKIAIVSNKSQTTRNRICGILTRGDTQLVFMDTPGYHKAKNRLGDYMVNVVSESIADIDAAVLLVEPIANVGTQEALLLQKLAATPVILVINKIDTVEKQTLLAVIDAYRRERELADIIPISAKTGDGVEALIDACCAFAVESPHYFDEDTVSDQPEKQMIAEILREKMLWCLEREIPHGTAVEILRFSERENGIVDIDATIYCEKASHKGIIIGKNGAMLKKISSLARADCEKFLATKVFLQTWVKVKENWRDNSFQLRNFGYE